MMRDAVTSVKDRNSKKQKYRKEIESNYDLLKNEVTEVLQTFIEQKYSNYAQP